MLAIPEASYVLEVFDENGTLTVAKFKFKVKELQAYIIEIPSTYCKGWNTQFEGFIRGGIANYTTIWYTTTTPDNSPPSQNANWEILGWNKTERSRRPKMEFNTNLSKTHWVKTKVIDSRGCSSESTIYKIEPELSQEPIIDLNDGRERLSKAEYFQTESNSSLLKGVNIDSYYFKVNGDTTSDVVISILKPDGINNAPKTVLKSLRFTASEFQDLQLKKEDFLLNQLTTVPNKFYIGVNSNTNSLFVKRGCNYTIEDNTAWEQTTSGKWQPLFTPVSEGGWEFLPHLQYVLFFTLNLKQIL